MADETVQLRIQGATNEQSYRGSHAFYDAVVDAVFGGSSIPEGAWYLDIGSGWGRTLRPFMRDFDLARMVGYEPNQWFCQVARSLNPYVCFINGPYRPDGFLPSGRFDLATAYSVFSHLSEDAAGAWVAEIARVLQPGGFFAFTTWGARFLERLATEEKAKQRGERINFYSDVVLKAAGDLGRVRERYESGAFVWLQSSESASYGEAFLSEEAVGELLKKFAPALHVVRSDTSSIAQDLFVVQRLPDAV